MFLEIEPEPVSTVITAVNKTQGVSDVPLIASHQQISRDAIYWTLFSIHFLLILLSFAFNLFMTIILIRVIPKIVCRSFYKIMLVFVATIVASSATDMLFMVYFEGMRCNSTVIYDITIIISLTASYYTTVLIFLLGLNRFAAFCSSKLNEAIMSSKPLCSLLTSLLLLSLIVSVVIYMLSGISISFDHDHAEIVNIAHNTVLVTVSNYIFYVTPLLSTAFYVICFIFLRSRRTLVKTKNTISLLDKAEKSTLKQGIVILFFHLVSLMVHMFHRFSPSEELDSILSRIEIVFSTAPHLAIPLTAIVYSKEIRRASWRLLVCHSEPHSPAYPMDSLDNSRNNSTIFVGKKSTVHP